MNDTVFPQVVVVGWKEGGVGTASRDDRFGKEVAWRWSEEGSREGTSRAKVKVDRNRVR